MICNTHYGYCGGKIKSLEGNFTYTGRYNLRSDGVLELLTSGTFTPKKSMVIDVFLVGGGGGGAAGNRDYYTTTYGGGGGGGYTATHLNQSANGAINVTIGSGGAGGTALNTVGWDKSNAGGDGGSTMFGSLSVAGGYGSTRQGSARVYQVKGGDGGSGGGGGSLALDTGDDTFTCAGGSNGENGQSAYTTAYNNTLNGGNGQGSTTREFGESTGKLYAGGGGGSGWSTSWNVTGGNGGGGRGTLVNVTTVTAGSAGTANTGGGGGGGTAERNMLTNGSAGGDGVVCIRLSA